MSTLPVIWSRGEPIWFAREGGHLCKTIVSRMFDAGAEVSGTLISALRPAPESCYQTAASKKAKVACGQEQ